MESIDSPRSQALIEKLRSEILKLWPCQSLTVSLDPVLSTAELQAFSCSPQHVVADDHRHHRVGPDRVARRQIADSMPGLLRQLAHNPPEDLLLVCPGVVYHHEAEEGLQARNELALWRLTSAALPLQCLDDLKDVLATILPRGMRLRTRRCEKSYLVYAQGLEVYCGGWKWIGHCGLINPMLLIESGFDPVTAQGVVLSLDPDRCMAVQDHWDEICLRRRG